MKINEYYLYYLTLHTNSYCRLLHFLGQLITLITFSYIAYENLWYYLPCIPFIIYPFAWSGHYFFEKNKPAAFNNLIKAKISDWIMFKEILFGNISIW